MRYESHINNIEPIIKAYEYYLSNNESQKKVCEKFNINYSAFVRYVSQFKGGYNRNFKVEIKKVPVANLKQIVNADINTSLPQRTANNRPISIVQKTIVEKENTTEMHVSVPKDLKGKTIEGNKIKTDSKGNMYMSIEPTKPHVPVR